MGKRKLFLVLYLFTVIFAAILIGPIGSFLAPLPLWTAGIAAALPTAVVIAEAAIRRSFTARTSLKLAGAFLAAGLCFFSRSVIPISGVRIPYGSRRRRFPPNPRFPSIRRRRI